MVSRAKGLKTDVRQLQLLLPKFVLQLEHDFRLGLGALAQPAVGRKRGGRKVEGGVTLTVTGHQRTHSGVTNTDCFSSRELKSRGKIGVAEENRQVR